MPNTGDNIFIFQKNIKILFDVSVCFLNFARVIALDRHIEILLLSNDCVIVPDFGGFIAHHVDARKDESDGSFLPPIRTIAFNPKLTINDSLLTQSYVEAYDISYPEATIRIEDEVRELRQRIETDGFYTFNGIGTIALNNEGNYEFTPCEAGILTPEFYGLGSFKTAELQELRAALLTRQQPLFTSVPTDGTTEAAANANVDSNVSDNKAEAGLASGVRFISLWRNLAAACVAVIAFLLFPAPLTNSTQLQESSIDTRLLDRIMPKDITTGQNQVLATMRQSSTKANSPRQTGGKAEASTAVRQAGTGMAQNATDGEPAESGYAIVLASRVTKANAKVYVETLHRRGYEDAYVFSKGSRNKVLYGHYANESDARNVLNRLNNRDEFAGAWITYVK